MLEFFLKALLLYLIFHLDLLLHFLLLFRHFLISRFQFLKIQFLSFTQHLRGNSQTEQKTIKISCCSEIIMKDRPSWAPASCDKLNLEEAGATFCPGSYC